MKRNVPYLDSRQDHEQSENEAMNHRWKRRNCCLEKGCAIQFVLSCRMDGGTPEAWQDHMHYGHAVVSSCATMKTENGVSNWRKGQTALPHITWQAVIFHRKHDPVALDIEGRLCRVECGRTAYTCGGRLPSIKQEKTFLNECFVV